MAEDDDIRDRTPPMRPWGELYQSQMGSLRDLAGRRVQLSGRSNTLTAYARASYLQRAKRNEKYHALMRSPVTQALYDLDDGVPSTLEDVARAKNAEKVKADEEKIKGQTKANKERAFELRREARLLRTIPGIAGTLPGRQGFDPGNPVAQALTDIWLGRQLDADIARKRLSTATNRRGALATRSGIARGRTNRRGALAQSNPGAVSTGASSPAVPRQSRVELPARSDTVNGPRARDATSSGMGKAEKSVSRSASQSAASASKQANGTLARMVSSVFAQPSRGLVAPRGSFARLSSARTTTRLSSGSAPRLSSPLLAAQVPGLTAFNSVGVASQASRTCECPPKKNTPRRSRGCTNPIVSRSVRDGIITTKRKLQCQPFRPK